MSLFSPPQFFADQQASDYYPRTVPPLPPQPPLTGEVTADLCVVGGGFAGLSAALHGAQCGLDVRLLEAATLGAGASGRNGGQVGSGQRLEAPDLKARFGLEMAKSLWRIGESAKHLVFDLIEEYGIACNLKSGIVYPVHKKPMAADLPHFVDQMQAEFGYSSFLHLSADELTQELNATGYHGAVLDVGAGHLNPLAYLHGLARSAIDLGATCHEDSRVTGWQAVGGQYVVQTGGGEVRCKHALF
ncbi:MAG: FAD-dependent oxidoreductase, partial [Pseudomonadota bacterium]